jgi:hypothetical protein
VWEYIQELLFYRFIRCCNCHDLYSIFDILKVKYQKTGIQKLINFLYTETLLYKNPMSATRHIKIECFAAKISPSNKNTNPFNTG